MNRTKVFLTIARSVKPPCIQDLNGVIALVCRICQSPLILNTYKRNCIEVDEARCLNVCSHCVKEALM